jgi:1,4-alpha-glucan branching enzyme
MLKKKFFKTKDECEVTFEVSVENADQVALVSEHNGWEPIEMQQVKDGPFRAKIRLPKESKFQFRYLVDGQEWRNDETADAYWTNEHGSENSVISTAA